MRHILFPLVSMIFLSVSCYGQFPNLAWGNFIGGTPVSYQNHIESDLDNNSYHMGFFSGTGEFGVTSGQVTHNSGSYGMVLTKRNPNGNTEWILPFNGVTVASFDIDSKGNILLYMQHNGGNLNPIAGNNYSGGSHYVLAKYASNGNLIWYKKSPNTFGLFQNKCLIKLDQNDNIYVSGPFIFTKDFDFSTASNTLSSGQYYSDLFVAKYTASGDFLWVKQIVAYSASAHVVSMAVNNNGNVYVAGWYSDTIVVDPVGASVQLVSTDEFGVNSESYLVGFGSTGNLLFANTFEYSDPLDIAGMHADNINLYLFHNMYGSVNINPNSGTPIYSSTRGSVLRISANTSTFYSNTAIADDATFIFSGRYIGGNYIFSGSYSGVTDFDPTSSVSNLGSLGEIGNFITEITPSFNYLGTKVFPTVNAQYCDVVRLNNSSLTYTGYNSLDFDIDYTSAVVNITSANSGIKDFLSHYSAQLPELNIVNESDYAINSGSTNPSLLNSTDFGDLCLGDSVTMTYSMVNTGLSPVVISDIIIFGPDATSYTLNGANGEIPVGDTMQFSVSIAGASVGVKNATVRVNNSDPDESAYFFDIQTTVRELPIVGFSLTPNNLEFCYGDTVLLSGTGAETYSWNNSVVDSVAFPIITGGSYEVIGTSIYGCKDTSSVSLTVNPLPIVSVSSNDLDNSICLNDSIQLIGSGAQSYTYSNGVQDQTDFYPTTTQNYTVTGTDINGCVNDTNITITVFSLPNVLVASNDPNDEICINDPIQLIGSGASTYAYSNGVIDQTDFYPTSTQTYSVTGTDVNGCSSTDNITITVNPLPTVSVTSNATNDEICLNDPIQLIGSGAASYSYSNGVIDQTDFYPTSDDSYTVTGTDANGCQNTASIFVTVNPLPTVSVVSSDADNAICLNDSIQLTASGASTYTYTNGVTDQVYFAPTSTNTYQVVGTDGNGCQDIDSIDIVVNSLPVVSITSSDLDDTICLNDSIQLIGSGAQSYTFDNGVQNGIYFYPTTTATYNALGTDTNGCENTSQLLITVNSLPNVDVISSDVNDSICIGDSISLSGLGAQSYVYSGGVSDQSYFTPSGTETFSIIGTDANGCIGTDSITIVVENLPNIDGGSDLFVCYGDSTILNAIGSGTITWTGNLPNGSYFSPTTSLSELICTAVSQSGCVNADTVNVDMGNQINTNTAIINVAIQAISSYDNYEWFDCQSGNTVQNGTQSSYFPSVDGEYAAIITDSDGCLDTTNCVLIDFLDVSSLTNVHLQFIPNPTRGILKVSDSEHLKSIRVYDSFGRLLLTQAHMLDTIDLSEFSTGQYLIHGTLENGETIIERVIKE